MFKFYFLSIVLSVLFIGKMQAQQTEQVSKLGVKYLEYFPEINEGDENLPLLIFLHGMGERGDDLTKLKLHGPPSFLDEKKDFPFITISPQCPDTIYWNEEILLPFYEEIIAKYLIDKKRIYLTGLSMGGFGTWESIVAKPDLFAAAAPICGGGDPSKLKAVKSMPIWVFHGAKDQVVPLLRSEEMVNKLKEVGSKVKFTIYPEATHDSWTETYANPKLYDWLLSHQKK
ncbi:prolyl oligopeptidase family serine peptidase [Marinifilum sp. N1E240]|uniref:carboxylesterase family protein n=1 Tax=Marinifilum sp. N1E240 TaxID=2608082 RepID=UPI001D03854F|nr:prolyl oligopeptidase family serine peptidase [Marinifilum sp. N1E240]